MIQIPNQLYFEEIVRQIADGSRSVKIKVNGKSMEPFLRDNKDYVVISRLPSPDKFRKNDLLLFQDHDRHLIHRLIKINHGTLTFNGDHQKQVEVVPAANAEAIITCIELANGRRIHRQSIAWKIRTCYSRGLFRIRQAGKKLKGLR